MAISCHLAASMALLQWQWRGAAIGVIIINHQQSMWRQCIIGYNGVMANAKISG